MNYHVTEEERDKRIKRVLELIKTGMSLRQCAEYLTKNEFPISYVTVADYVKRAEKLNTPNAKEAIHIIQSHQPLTIDNIQVQERIKQVYELLKEGFTFDEVASKLNTTPMIVYRDFTSRIDKLTKEQLKELDIDLEEVARIKANFKLNSISNLKNQGSK